jgi:DNA polymerase-3 subunit chi
MADILFYHLEQQSLDSVLPMLLEKTLERGWRAGVETGLEPRLETLDSELWTYKEESFLPHCISASEKAATSPIVLTGDDQNLNNAQVRFYIDGATPGDFSEYERIVIMFDGRDELETEKARSLWKTYQNSEHEPTYWQQGASGKWEKKA